MDRRRLLIAVPLSMAAFGSASVNAQALRRPLRIGFLSTGGVNSDFKGPEPTNASASALLQGLRDLGYRYGSDVVLEGRGGEGRPDRYATIAGELVTANVDVIVAAGPTVDAVRRATSKIPIVMVGGAVDPVETKLVARRTRRQYHRTYAPASRSRWKASGAPEGSHAWACTDRGPVGRDEHRIVDGGSGRRRSARLAARPIQNTEPPRHRTCLRES
jgi:hypothetical protein